MDPVQQSAPFAAMTRNTRGLSETGRRRMSTPTVIELKHQGKKREIEDHESDLIHNLGRRLGCLWQHDRYIVNADGHPELEAFWRHAKSQEQENIDQLKKPIQCHF